MQDFSFDIASKRVYIDINRESETKDGLYEEVEQSVFFPDLDERKVSALYRLS